MKIGKVSNSIAKRSIFKLISKLKDSKLIRRAAIGHDCGGFRINVKEKEAVEVVSATACGINAVYNVSNNLLVSGSKAEAVQLCIIMPETAREIRLKEIMQSINTDCLKLGIEISGGHTQVSRDVLKPVISVTATGVGYEVSEAKPGQDIIMTKYIGIGGIQQIMKTKEQEIRNHFNDDVWVKAFGKREYMSVAEETELVRAAAVGCMHDVSEGGIFAALWDFAENSRVGIDVDFRKIPVCQEIIEICELFDINPYKLDSTGCLLMTADNGCDIVNLLEHAGIKAAVIGSVISGNDKLIRNLDEVRYLDTPEPDEVYRFIS